MHYIIVSVDSNRTIVIMLHHSRNEERVKPVAVVSIRLLLLLCVKALTSMG